MNKYVLNCKFFGDKIVNSSDAIWDKYEKSWVFYGCELPKCLAVYIDSIGFRVEFNIENKCNFCKKEFDTEITVRQSKQDRPYLATFVKGLAVQECCAQCADAIGYSIRN